jgi:cell filamentation protein
MTLMALQAGLPLLDFSVVAGKSKDAYIAAIQAGLEKRYAPMEKLVAEVIEQSRASS